MRAFTLIELAIAIFIALIIFLVGFAAISTTLAVKRDSTARVGATEDAREVMALLRRDIASSYSAVYMQGATSDELDLDTVDDLHIRWFVNQHNYLCREKKPSADPDASALIDNVHSIQFRPRVYNEDVKQLTAVVVALSQATDLQVMLYIYDLQRQPKRTFEDTFTLPTTFHGTP